MRNNLTREEILSELAWLEARQAYLRRRLEARRYYNAQPINPIKWLPQPQPQPRVRATAFVVYGD